MMVDAAEVQAHLRMLVAADMGRNEIARRAQISASTVSVHLRGEWPTIQRTIAVRILAVLPDAPTPSAMVSSVGTVRRVRALAVLRYSTSAISRECGLSSDSVCDLLAGRRPTVSVATRDAVAAASRRLARVLGPSERAARRARAEGWYSFAAWDDIDDPECAPHVGGAGGGSRRQEIVEETAVLAARGVPRDEIAERLGVKWNTVLMAHARCGVSLMGVIS